MTTPTINDIREAFSLLTDWEDRYRFLIELGEQLPPLDATQRCEANRVTGCLSKVWIVARPAADDPGRLEFLGDSETSTIKGLVAVLIAIYSGNSPENIADLDPDCVFETLGLHDHLSPNRHVGVYAMVERIRALARPHLASPTVAHGNAAGRLIPGITPLT